MASPIDISALLPPSLDLPPHLSAHKYFFVCTLTVAAWDTLVLSPRTWRLFRTQEWPPLKIVFHILRLLMPAEFVIVAVAFFDTSFSRTMCDRFVLFEPIVTAVLVNLCALVHAVRIYAIYDRSRPLAALLGAGLLAQIATMAVACAFFRVVPLLEGQGCIAGPRHTWVGVYWLAPTLFFLTTFALALRRSVQSRAIKPIGAWKLMLRDGLNLYGAVAGVNTVNAVFWFVARPTGDADTIRTLVTSMAAVLTTTMTLRIVLGVRGSLADGGAYAGTSTAGANAAGSTRHVVSTRATPVVNIGASQQMSRGAFTLDEIRAKTEREFMAGGDGDDGKGTGPYTTSSEIALDDVDAKRDEYSGGGLRSPPAAMQRGVKVTIDRETDFRGYGKQ